MSGELSGRVALVTGARAGLGAATAMALADAGATVVACGRHAGDCAEIVVQITAAGGRAFDHALDVADLESVEARIETAAAVAGGLDIIVNNAATIEPMAPIEALDAAAFDLALRTNVSGPAAIVAAAWPLLVGHGRIVNILSGAALSPLRGWAAYCSSKAALLMLTKVADLEGIPVGIRCFGLAPGLVDTAMQGSIRAAKINQISDIPRANLAAPGDVAPAVVWLAGGSGDRHGGDMVDVRNVDFRAEAGL